MEDERYVLINRIELAAERADGSGFRDTAHALLAIAVMFSDFRLATRINSDQLQYSD